MLRSHFDKSQYKQKGFGHILLIIILLAGIGIAVYLTQFTQVFKPKAAENPQPATPQFSYFKMADSSDNGYPYAYAPSIIKKDGKYHVFYCSMPINSPESLDTIRYTSSTDGVNWTTPVVKLISKSKTDANGFIVTSACDPSLVYYQGFYYLYTTNVWRSKPEFSAGPGVVAVSRSDKIDGTYLTYTERGTWEQSPVDAKNIVVPLDPYYADQPTIYGAGQQSVIEKDGKLIMFHTDNPPGTSDPVHIYKRESTNPVDWSTPPVMTTLSAHSTDIKYNAYTDQFVMAGVFPFHTADSSLMFMYSKDGITWHNSGTTSYLGFNWPTVTPLIYAADFPNFAHNVGMSSDEKGHLINDGSTLVGFGAPYDLNTQDTWGNWDLYGLFLDINVQPVGFLDDANCQQIRGWACEIDNIDSSTEVHLYFDGIPGSGAYGIPGIIANIPRESAVGQNCGGNSSKGYSYSTPEFLKDGRPHEVRAYAINTPPGSNPQLHYSPKTIQCAVSPSPIPSSSVSAKPGDTDGDGDVDIFDYNRVVTDFGKKNDPSTKADLDNDNDVDIFDYNIVVTNFDK